MPDLFPPTINDEIACIERELKLRLTVYPKLIAKRRMAQFTADRETVLMRSVLSRLQAIKANDVGR